MGGFVKICKLRVMFFIYVTLAMRTSAAALALTKFNPCLLP